MNFNFHAALQAFVIGFGQVIAQWEFIGTEWHSTIFFMQGILQAGLGLAGHHFTPKGTRLK